MPTKKIIALTASFLVVFLVFLVILMPAQVVKAALMPTPDVDSGAPDIRVSGLWWKGHADSIWKQQLISVNWEMDWRGLTPGLLLESATGEIEVSGWFGVSNGGWELADANALLPARQVSEFLPMGRADGVLKLSQVGLSFSDDTVEHVSGALHYTGGELNWGFGEPVNVPPLDGLLSMQASGPQLEIQDNKKQKLAMAFVEDKRLVLQVLQAFPQLLGMAELGGDPNEEVYRTSRPLDLSALDDGAGA